MKMGIIGYGHVGIAMHKLIPDAVVHDKFKQIGTEEGINGCDVGFVCVPTPAKESGECDTSIVEEVLNWLNTTVIVLRSTVPVGFTETMTNKLKKRIVFQPEYYGETTNHPFSNLLDRTWLTLGGKKDDVEFVIKAYQKVYNADVRIMITDARTAELAKYMENCFLATKVTFCNEFFDIAKGFDVSYSELREVWLADPRMGRSHTFVYEDNRGFGGKCLPKDMKSIIYQSKQANLDVSFLESVENKNKQYKLPPSSFQTAMQK